MKSIAAWVAVNALLVSAHLVAAATSWALGTLLITFAPGLTREWWAWFMVGSVALAAAIAFLFWVVGFAKREHRHV